MSIEDERACEALVIAYSHLIDMGHAERVHELFTDDAVWESPELRLDGRAAIERGFLARQARADRRSRHFCTNIAISVDPDTGEAAGLTYFQLYRHDGDGDGPRPLDGQPVVLGEYHDRFVKVPDGWRIKHRRATASFTRTDR